MRREILSTYCIDMSGRMILTRQSKQNVDNHYVVGAGVGAKTTSVRRALKQRANNAQRPGPDGKSIWGPCVGFCPRPAPLSVWAAQRNGKASLPQAR